MIPDRSHIRTEQPNPASARLDSLPLDQAIALMHAEDLAAVHAVGKRSQEIAQAVEWIAASFLNHGRLIYAGTGASGRLAVLDAAECPPTFCSDPDMVIALIAGGDHALRKSIENVEDDPHAGAQAIKELAVDARNVVLGIAAGGTTPYVHGALLEAHTRRAKTIFLLCTDPAHAGLPQDSGVPDLFIAVDTGPEILAGSTRLKAGTATKLVLNTLTTLAMVRIGKTYGNLMVNIDATKNRKLLDRGARIISRLTNLPREAALELLEKSGGKVKHAVVMHHRQCDIFTANTLLEDAAGRLRAVIG